MRLQSSTVLLHPSGCATRGKVAGLAYPSFSSSLLFLDELLASLCPNFVRLRTLLNPAIARGCCPSTLYPSGKSQLSSRSRIYLWRFVAQCLPIAHGALEAPRHQCRDMGPFATIARRHRLACRLGNRLHRSAHGRYTNMPPESSIRCNHCAFGSRCCHDSCRVVRRISICHIISNDRFWNSSRFERLWSSFQTDQ